MPQDGKTPPRVPRHFRWTLGEYLNLPFEAFDHVALRLEKRRLQPDAMLEDPAHQRRYFIEYETGSATINDAKKTTSTRAELDRYVAFFNGNYRTRFRDAWRPRLLFVSQSEARAASIAELLAKEGFPASGAFGGRALTLDAAKHFLNAQARSIHFIGRHRTPGATAPSCSTCAPRPSAARSNRHGRPALPVFRLLQNALEALRHSGVKPETIPRIPPEAAISCALSPATPAGRSRNSPNMASRELIDVDSEVPKGVQARI